MRHFQRRIADWLRFQVERFLIGGPVYLLTFVAVLIVGVSVTAGGLVWYLDPQAESFIDSVWWAFLRLSDPGYLGDDKGVWRKTISTVVTVLGYVLFMGALVAVLTQWLHKSIRQLESGLTPVYKKNHIVILGWTNRTATIVHNLLSAGKRLDRFLELIGKSSLSIVILTKEVTPELAQTLREELGRKWNKRQIIFRSGDPLKINDLQRVDLWNASIVIISGSIFSSRGPEVVDSKTIKTLLSISNEAKLAKRSPPVAITELFDQRKIPLATSSYKGRIEIVSTHLLISRLISQFIRNPGVSRVYEELLSEEGSNSVYVRETPDLFGVRWGSLFGSFDRTIPIGLIRNKTETILGPELDLTVQKGDKLVFLARSMADTHFYTQSENSVEQSGKKKKRLKSERTILVLGWGSKVPVLLEELSSFDAERVQCDIGSLLSEEERKSDLERFPNAQVNVSVRHFVLDYSVPTEVENIDFQKYDNILIIAGDWLPTIEEADAKSVLGYLLVREKIEKLEKKPRIVLELFDPDNLPIFNRGHGDAIVSPSVVSHMLANTALRPDMNQVFQALCDSSETSISFYRPESFSVSNEETFEDIQRKVNQSGQIALGIKSLSKKGVLLNPPREVPLELSEGDKIVVLGHLE